MFGREWEQEAVKVNKEAHHDRSSPCRTLVSAQVGCSYLNEATALFLLELEEAREAKRGGTTRGAGEALSE